MAEQGVARSMWRWQWAPWLSLVLVVGMAAAACDVRNIYPPCAEEPVAADTQAAKGAHTAASRFYERGEYAKAIDLWSYAYELDCNALGLLINIGTAYERMGNDATALDVFELYIERAGPAADPVIVAKVKAARRPPAAEPWSTDGGVEPEPIATEPSDAGAEPPGPATQDAGPTVVPFLP